MGTHSNRGMKLEKTVEKLFQHYEEQNIFCHKLEVKEVGGIKVKKSPFDYLVFHANKLHAFDTKNCNSLALGIANLKLHQVKALSDVEQQGGEAFFLIFFASISQLEKLPVSEARELISKGIKSIKPDIRRKIKLDFLDIL